MTYPVQTAFKNTQVKDVFEGYPQAYAKKLLFLRELIFKVASEMGGEALDETLKWGEPSYLTNNGSTIRLAWRRSYPQQYAILFNCKTSLIETFKEVYGDIFSYEGNRAIVFGHNDDVPINALTHCIELSLYYKRIKHLPLLGL